MLKRLPCIVPNPAEQDRIAVLSSAQNALIQAELGALTKYRQSKAGLMQDLLIGKVRVKVDEVAAAGRGVGD